METSKNASLCTETDLVTTAYEYILVTYPEDENLWENGLCGVTLKVENQPGDFLRDRCIKEE